MSTGRATRPWLDDLGLLDGSVGIGRCIDDRRANIGSTTTREVRDEKK